MHSNILSGLQVRKKYERKIKATLIIFYEELVMVYFSNIYEFHCFKQTQHKRIDLKATNHPFEIIYAPFQVNYNFYVLLF